MSDVKKQQFLPNSTEYELFLDKMSDVAYFVDNQGNLVWVNQAASDIVNVPKEELIGTPFLPYVIPEHQEKAMEDFRRVLSGESTVSTYTYITGVTCRFSTYPRKDEDGNIFGAYGIAENITDRLASEQALRDSEERFKAIHDASFGGIAIHDKGVILECNHGLSDITGFDYEELIGMNGLLLISENTRAMVIEKISSHYERPYEAEGVRKNGEVYPLRLEAREIPYKGKQVRVVEFRDLTNEKVSEAEKNNLENQLQQAQKLEAIGRLAGGVAHDFNNMLTAIIGNSELALTKIDENSSLFIELNEIEKAARRSADLTRQLLAFSRKQTISPKVLHLNDTLADLTKMLTRLIGEDITLSLETEKELWPIKADTGQLAQMLTNLCINGKDAINGVGQITIKTNNIKVTDETNGTFSEIIPGEYVRLTVEDNGCGMEEELLLHIFEPFFTTKKAGKGTGLGLATVYGAVKQNKGHIRVKTHVGKGTSFELYLPRYKSDNATCCTSDLSLLSNQGTETILLVEDEVAILNVTAKQLNKLGYSVIAANTPSEAIRVATEFEDEIHLLITDVVMPEMNGNELSKEIISLHPKIKLLFMSGYTADVIADHGILNEGLRFIEKPFSIDDLGSSVREALDS